METFIVTVLVLLSISFGLGFSNLGLNQTRIVEVTVGMQLSNLAIKLVFIIWAVILIWN